MRSCSGRNSVIFSVNCQFKSSATRSAASSFSFVCLPTILVFTGPAAGKLSVIVSLWKRITASVIMGWNTPQAPGQGSERSSYFKPSNCKPSLSIISQSLRESRSLRTSPAKSLTRSCSSRSSISSARLAPKSSLPSSPGSISISKPPTPILTDSGSSISISISGSGARVCNPWGAS